ncbi:MAG: DNA-directed RNA polymerase [Polyangiaceae bacterium]|nr:DNA-directed RNA polymerase [Polyangiaceae bacterium]
MRNIALLAVPAAFLGLLSTGCQSVVPFTHEIRMQHRLTDDEVRNLQFYSSHQITLRREASSQDRQVTPGHKLRLISGKSVEEVVIPAKTPGVAARVTSRSIAVSFVEGTSLEFAVGSRSVPLGSWGDSLKPFAVAEGTYAPRAAVRSNLFGQYAEPPNNGHPVKVVGPSIPPPSVMEDLTGGYFLAAEPSGQVSFAGQLWEGVDDTIRAHLLIDSDKLEETEERRTVLPGVRLGN